jgi:5-methyltetrahydrofolate--homocysteine methyltransferase
MDLLTRQNNAFIRLLHEKIVVFDGAMGTEIQKLNLTPDDFAGDDGLNEILVVTRPDVIKAIHASYFEAGSDVVETDTFGSSSIVLDEYDKGARAYELSKAAAVLAKDVASSFSTKDKPRFVSGSVGPTTKLCSLGHIGFDDLHTSYITQIRGLLAGGVDLLQIETCQDPLQIKAAVQAAHEAFKAEGRRVPIIVQITVETVGTMLVGTETSAALVTLEALPIEGIGMNCATGPDLMKEHIRHLGQNSTRFISCLPNAGLPRNVGGKAVYDLTPEQLSAALTEFVSDLKINMVGGCCGTGPTHIKALAEAVKNLAPAPRPTHFVPQVSSLYQAVPLDQDGTSPLFIGERTNANGSKLFKELLLKEDWSGITEMAKEQEREGSHVLDLCVAYVGRDEVRDMQESLKRIATQVTLPLMIDSTQTDVLEAALKMIGGRAIINSINLEDGEPKLDEICRLASRFGCALVALTIDEEGMAKTAARKLEVARRIYDLVTKRHGLPGSALLFDPLTFTIASGDEDSRRAGVETLEGINLIKKHLPGVRTMLGLSNISFGLKPYPRQILNSVYLEEAIQHGLDGAILHAKKIIPISQIADDDLAIARDLIYDRRSDGYDPLFAFMERFADAKAPTTDNGATEADQPVEEVLKKRIISGNKVGIEIPLQRALEKYQPLKIINEILLDGMKVVGDLFGSGKMQLPFVLQSAETMKTAVAFLEKFMTKIAGSEKGSIVLATVKGDVHDIGKNLVDIILSNNGYKVYNLGIKQPLDTIMAAVKEHNPTAVGLSGLLVKSTVVMKENLEEMTRLGQSIPVICGGAALNKAYVEDDLRKAYPSGKVFYGQDAFTGLGIMEELTGNAKELKYTVDTGPGRERKGSTRAERERVAAEAMYDYVKSEIAPATSIPKPPFWGQKVLTPKELDLREIFKFINKKSLFALQWQYKRNKDQTSKEHTKFIEEKVEPKFREWQDRAIKNQYLMPQAVYGYYQVNSDKNDLIVFEPDSDKEIVRFTFPRQLREKRRCIADYFLPIESGRRDVLAVSLVTMGSIASQSSQKLFEANLYDDYLHFHGLSVESAEALAEWMHKKIRVESGFAEDDGESVEQLFRQSYRGSRYSFGYPACPRLEDQEKLFKVIDPTAVGVELSDEFQLHPEQSTSAIVVHHQESTYFSI